MSISDIQCATILQTGTKHRLVNDHYNNMQTCSLPLEFMSQTDISFNKTKCQFFEKFNHWPQWENIFPMYIKYTLYIGAFYMNHKNPWTKTLNWILSIRLHTTLINNFISWSQIYIDHLKLQNFINIGRVDYFFQAVICDWNSNQHLWRQKIYKNSTKKWGKTVQLIAVFVRLSGFQFILNSLRWSKILWLFEEVHVAFLNSLLRNLGQS